MRLRGSNLDAPFTGEQLSEMKYTRQVGAGAPDLLTASAPSNTRPIVPLPHRLNILPPPAASPVPGGQGGAAHPPARAHGAPDGAEALQDDRGLHCARRDYDRAFRLVSLHAG